RRPLADLVERRLIAVADEALAAALRHVRRDLATRASSRRQADESHHGSTDRDAGGNGQPGHSEISYRQEYPPIVPACAPAAGAGPGVAIVSSLLTASLQAPATWRRPSPEGSA